MRLAELQQLLRAVDPAVVLVAPRTLDRIIQHAINLPGMLWAVPHRQSWIVDRQLLFQHVEQEDLALEPDQLLPPTVILLAQPSPEDLQSADRKAVLLEYWRRLFHISVHLALENRC